MENCFALRIRHDLICYGDRFTEKEAYTALEEAPIGNKNKPGEPPMIDYQGFCKLLGGLRKRKPSENWVKENTLISCWWKNVFATTNKILFYFEIFGKFSLFLLLFFFERAYTFFCNNPFLSLLIKIRYEFCSVDIHPFFFCGIPPYRNVVWHFIIRKIIPLTTLVNPLTKFKISKCLLLTHSHIKILDRFLISSVNISITVC